MRVAQANWMLDTDSQQQEAASRRMLRVSQLQRWITMRFAPLILRVLLLSTGFGTAYANDVTGSWEYKGPAESGMWLKTQATGDKVRFQLEVARGAPSYNSGWIEGEFDLDGTSGVFRSTEYGDCEIAFEFTRSSVRIAEGEDKGQCGFGYNVFADGTLRLKSRSKPTFSDADPRFSSK